MIQKRNKITLQSCQELAESKGGKFLSPEYSVSGARYKWQCSNGHIFEIQHSRVNRGDWCRECKLQKKNYMEKCHKIAESKGGKCLSTKCQSNWSKLTWECKHGHIFSRSLNAINEKNKWCFVCEKIERKNLNLKTYEKTEINQKQQKPMGVFQMMDEWQKMSKNEDAIQRLLNYIIERKSEVNSQSNSINWGRYLALQEIESWMMFNFKFDDKAEKQIVQDDKKVMFDQVNKKSGRNPNQSNIKLSQISKKAREIRMENEPWKDALQRARAIIYDIKETEPEQIDILQHIYASQKTPDELKEINTDNIIKKVKNRLNELFQ
jgi:hypothetical protein